MSSVSSTTSIDVAHVAAPFDHEKADIILRSSDHVDFRVFKLFLSLASPFFETLFSIPQPAEESKKQEIKDGLAVIPVTEDSWTLDSLLRFCYPYSLVEDPKIEALEDVLDILEAARKYSIGNVEKKARQATLDPKILGTDPLRCFAIVHRGRLREEATLAARHTLTQPLIPSWFEEIELITATDLLSLLTYHHKCGEAVYALRLDLSWITSHYRNPKACPWLIGDCQCLKIDQSRPRKFLLFGDASLGWWEDFMEETFTALREKPCKETVQACAKEIVRSVKLRGCEHCSLLVTEGMRDFVELFASKIDKTVSKIKLELDF